MLKIVCLITLLTVGFSTLVINGFRDISESVPKENINLSLVFGVINFLEAEDREQQIEACYESCRKSEFFCNSFVVLATEEHNYCIMATSVGSSFETSVDQSNVVVAVYVRESLPTAHELSRRFSNFPSDQQVNYMLEKYGMAEDLNLPENWEAVIPKILETCSTALEKNFPVVISITDWLRTGDLARSRLRRQNEFRNQLYRALELWQAWPRNRQAPLQYTDTLVLTFLDIFFKSLDERITTIYDPNEKILIVEEPKKHLLIRSFGPGDYVLIFIQDEGDSPPTTYLCSTYGRQRSEIDHETLEMFKGAMERFGHKVSDEKLGELQQLLVGQDSHTLSLQVILDAATLMLSNHHGHVICSSYEILFQDFVTAVVSSVIENENPQQFQSNLAGARGRLGFMPGGVDVNIITG